MEKKPLTRKAKLGILIAIAAILVIVGIFYVIQKQKAQQDEEATRDTVEIVENDSEVDSEDVAMDTEESTRSAHDDFRWDLYNKSSEEDDSGDLPFVEDSQSAGQNDHQAGTEPEETVIPVQTERETEEATEAPTEQSGIYVTENGTYTDREGVAQYLHTYGRLPSNFITKKQAKKYGWDSGENLNAYAPGKSIGGDVFTNYEGVPGKGTFHECDINYRNGKRGAERIIWSGDGRIYYTPDHYTTYYEWLGPNNWVYAYRYDG